MQKVLGFLPDADPSTPGVLTSVTNMIPYEKGMKAAPTGQTPSDVPVLADTCAGAAVVTKLDGSRRIFAGTITKLYELQSGSWVDVSSGTYTGTADSKWSITQFGNSTLASNKADTIQRSAGSGSFAAISGAPKAKIVFSVGTQVMALNVNDGTDKPDGWHCCAVYDETDWTPSTVTLANNGRIVSAPGEFTAGGKLGEYAIGYKEKSIHIGQFVNAPLVWDWTQAAGGDAGCVGQDAWCDIGGAHFLVGIDNFWIFDGSRPVPVGENQTRRWFYENANASYLYRTQCVCDRQNNVVWIFYCSSTASTPDKALVYHLKTQQWGLVNINVEATLNYTSSGFQIDDLPTLSATIDGLSGFTFNSQFWLTGGRSLAAFNSSHQLQSITGPAASSGMTSGDVGDDDQYTLLNRIRVRFEQGYKPTAASCESFTRASMGDAPAIASSASMTDGGRFDVIQSARWHRAAFNFTGDCRVMGMDAELIPEGEY